MSEKKTVNVSFKGRDIETKCDGKVKTFINPVTGSSEAEKMFIDEMQLAVENIISRAAPEAMDAIKNNQRMIRDRLRSAFLSAANQTLKTDGIDLFTQQLKYCSHVSTASRRTHALTQYPYNGDFSVSMTKLFDPKELGVVNNMIVAIDKACNIMSDYAPASAYNQLIARNEYVYQRCMSTFEHIEDQNKADDAKRLAILNLLSDTILNIDQTLYEINSLLCPGTENSLAVVIRPMLAIASEDMLMLRDHIETEYAKR